MTVLETTYRLVKNRMRGFCLCKCDCGNIKEVCIDYLLYNQIPPSCGCVSRRRKKELNRNDLIGQKFGKLTVLEMLWDYRPTKCRCLCDCGTEIIVIATQLTSGGTKSCGCWRRERASKSATKDFRNISNDYGIEFIKPQYQQQGHWIWQCKCFCGNYFDAVPAKILNGHTTSCGCRKKSSREQLIANFLKDNNIEYETEYTFPDCKDKYVLRFDFALLKNGELFYLLEYDGQQHFNAVAYWGGNETLSICQQHDQLKNEFCQANNIPLLRLPYTLTDNEIKNSILNIINP